MIEGIELCSVESYLNGSYTKRIDNHGGDEILCVEHDVARHSAILSRQHGSELSAWLRGEGVEGRG